MAAWNGIPAGERYLRLRLAAKEERPAGASKVVFLRVPAPFQREDLADRAVRVTGRWTKPAAVSPIGPGGSPRQMPIRSIRLEPLPKLALPKLKAGTTPTKPSGIDPTPAPKRATVGSVIVQPEPIFIASEVKLLP